MASPRLEGQLIRPVVAMAGWSALTRAAPADAFWDGVMAVQLAHEASLLHDDVVDGAGKRRGVATVAAERGVAAALVQGDHLLTSAYRYAVRTGSSTFVEIFARSVERTVAGEIAQARATGRILPIDEYVEIVRGKSGQLLGCSLAVAPCIIEPPRAERLYSLGCEIGVVYQMLDDLLDLTPLTDTGKPALQDYAHKHWTWPLPELGITTFDLGREALVATVRSRGAAVPPLNGALSSFQRSADGLLASIEEELGASSTLDALVADWRSRASDAVMTELRAGVEPPLPAPSRALVARIPDDEGVESYFARNSRSFRFASRFFSSEDEARVARVYAYCRCTDDLVDVPDPSGAPAADLLSEWLSLSRQAYSGNASGIPFLDRVMGEMAAGGVPFRYAEELVEGMRMDLRGETYDTVEDLRRYTYRVASVVGLWITEMFGIRDPRALRLAEAMGHAMQLTNILRDVGEDVRAGRCYLPAELLARYDVRTDQLRNGEMPEAYGEMMEELMSAADAAYRAGLKGIPLLPARMRLPIAVAAYLYRGILREIRAKNYDNLTIRARTSGLRKVLLSLSAMLSLRPVRSRHTVAALGQIDPGRALRVGSPLARG